MLSAISFVVDIKSMIVRAHVRFYLIFLYLLRLSLCSNMWSVLDTVTQVSEEKVFSLGFGCTFLLMSLRSFLSVMLTNARVSLVSLCWVACLLMTVGYEVTHYHWVLGSIQDFRDSKLHLYLWYWIPLHLVLK